MWDLTLFYSKQEYHLYCLSKLFSKQIHLDRKKGTLDFLIIGMNGYEPGGKECPTSLTFMQIVGSISSFTASSYYDFLIDPKRVFVFDMLPLLFIFCFAIFCCSCAISLLFLLSAPLFNVTKH